MAGIALCLGKIRHQESHSASNKSQVEPCLAMAVESGTGFGSTGDQKLGSTAVFPRRDGLGMLGVLGWVWPSG